MSPGQFFFGQCTVLPDLVLYNVSTCGDEPGVYGDEDKGVGVCKGLKLGVLATSK